MASCPAACLDCYLWNLLVSLLCCRAGDPPSAPFDAVFLYDRNVLTRVIICDVIALILKEEGVWCHISGKFIFVLEKNT